MNTRLRSTAGVVVAGLLISFSVRADPIGTQYTVSTDNFPGTAGPVVLDFDGLAEEAVGTGLTVSEMSTTLADGSELIEFWFETSDGLPFVSSADPDAAAAIWIEGLSWSGGASGRFVEDSIFVYFTADGVPQPMSDVLDQGLVFAAHPLDPGLQVALAENPVGPATQIHFDTADFPATLGQALSALGLTQGIIDDFHIGAQVVHAPEPATPLLLVLAFTPVLWGRRRRSPLAN